MLLMAHANPARVEGGFLYVDRKFHSGMQEYTKRLEVPIVSLHPYLPPAEDPTVMDLVCVPVAELGYRVETLEGGPSPWRATPPVERKLSEWVQKSHAVYGGGRVLSALARRASVPTVALLEYNVKTMLVFATDKREPAWKQAIAQARALRYYARDIVPTMRSATMLHCNGYPIFEESRWFNEARLLYLDSRMSQNLLIPQPALQERLAKRNARTPRLIYSGRFEPGKGALDVVLTAKECAANGLEFSLDLYGQGSQRAAMVDVVERFGLGGFVKIHDVIPYPELVQRTRASDIFVCCHVQDDPSCTYLETMGSGVPIAGYANAMWAAMSRDSRAGVVAPLGDTKALARSIAALCRDASQLDALSLRARAFAEQHTFEAEFSRRTDSLREIMARSRAA